MEQPSLTTTIQQTLATAAQDPTWQAIAAVTILVFVLAGFRLCAKAGYHPMLGLLLFVPLVNLGVFLFLAFSRWPIERRLRDLGGVADKARRADERLLRRAG